MRKKAETAALERTRAERNRLAGEVAALRNEGGGAPGRRGAGAFGCCARPVA